MRLIDAENTIGCTDCVVYDYCRAGIFKNCKCIVENIFDSQPIAYDVDKVVEEIDRCSVDNTDWKYSANPKLASYYLSRTADVVDIVKRGGVNVYKTV